MPISINNDIGPIIERRMPALLTRFPEHAQIISQLRADFFTTFANHPLEELRQGSFCNVLNPWIAARVQDQDLVRAIQEERIEIFGDLMRVLRPRFSAIPLRDVVPSLATNRNGTVPATPRRTPEQISTIAMQYASLAAFLGNAEALDILVMVGILSPGERADALSFIAPYLGESEARAGEGGCVVIIGSDERILQNATVFEKMRTSLVTFCYQKLMEEQADTLANQPESLTTIESWVSQQLDGLYSRAFKGRAETISTTHKDLYSSVVNHFKAAAALKIPDSMSKTTFDHNGTEWPLGSWRQRLALVDMLNPAQRHTYIGIDAGGGKTFAYLWGFELAKEERRREKLPGRPRMLIFSTKAIISEIPNRVRQGSAPKETDALYYPDPEQAPTVGVIRAGMTPEQIHEAASQDIVFCAYSMWHTSRSEEVDVEGEAVRERFSIEDLLIEQSEPFTSITFDEAHLLQGDGKRTRLARDTIRRIPNLYTQGHIVGGSGTPAPGHLNGLRVVLELFEPPRGSTARNERKDSPPNHWAELRRMLGKLWRMDKPEEWMEHVEIRGYPLSARENDLVQLIVEDNTIDAQSKLQMLLLIVRCPRLMGSDPRMPWTASEQTKLALSELLFGENRSSILVAENMRADGVLRPTKDEDVREEQNPDDFFFQDLQAWCELQDIEFHVIHGDVKENERIVIYDQMRAAKQEGRKCVVYANSACLNLGIDLTDCCDGIVSQQWPYNTPDLYQLLKRVLRKGNTNCRMIVLAAQGTVEQGILTSAQHKYADVTRCLHGITLSDERMAELSETGLNPEDEDIMRRIESSEQQWERFSRSLQGKGSAEIREFWEGYLDEFLVLLERKEGSSIGDDDRAIAGIVRSLEESGLLDEGGSYLHTCSFGQRLRDHLLRASPDFRRSVRSMDATQEMLDYGGMAIPAVSGNIVATPADLYRKVLDAEVLQGSQDLVVLQGFEQTSHSQSESLQLTGRLRALRGAVLSLRSPDTVGENGGILMIPLPFEACTREQMNTLKDQLVAFGLELLPGYTGNVTSQDNEGEPGHRMYVMTAKKVLEFDPSLLSSIQSSSFVLTALTPKSAHMKYRNRKLPFSLPHTHFKLGRKDVSLPVSLPERENKLRYLERLTDAVTTIRSLASSSTELIEKLGDTDTQNVFSALGVTCFPHLHTQGRGVRRPNTQESAPRRLAFRFDKSPLFYPFDRQWAERPTEDSE